MSHKFSIYYLKRVFITVGVRLLFVVDAVVVFIFCMIGNQFFDSCVWEIIAIFFLIKVYVAHAVLDIVVQVPHIQMVQLIHLTRLVLQGQAQLIQLICPTKYDWTAMANSILHGCTDPYDMAKTIYLWLADNIQYDTSYSIYDADTAWEKRKGVCKAYSELFYRIGTAAGLDVRVITGNGRGGNSEEFFNHCWIVVNKASLLASSPCFPEKIICKQGQKKLDYIQATKGLDRNNSILIDPTWGAGDVRYEESLKNKNDLSWFDVDPSLMIFTHYPENPKDQMLGEYVLPVENYKCLPCLTPNHAGYFAMDGTDLLSRFINKPSRGFPDIYSGYDNYLEIVKFPWSRHLRRNHSYKIIVRKKKHCHVVIADGNNFYKDDSHSSAWIYDGRVWSISFVVESEDVVYLGIKKHKNGRFYPILKYKVKLNT